MVEQKFAWVITATSYRPCECGSAESVSVFQVSLDKKKADDLLELLKSKNPPTPWSTKYEMEAFPIY